MKDREDTGQGLQAGAVPPKPRKAYVLTKTRESWSEEEHGRFVEALRLYARDWKRIEEHVGTKSATQIRSHAQKHFHKAVQQGEEIPPPRAKRRSAAPTPRLRPLPQQQQQQQQGTHAPQRQPSHRQQQQQQQQQRQQQQQQEQQQQQDNYQQASHTWLRLGEEGSEAGLPQERGGQHQGSRSASHDARHHQGGTIEQESNGMAELLCTMNPSMMGQDAGDAAGLLSSLGMLQPPLLGCPANLLGQMGQGLPLGGYFPGTGGFLGTDSSMVAWVQQQQQQQQQQQLTGLPGGPSFSSTITASQAATTAMDGGGGGGGGGCMPPGVPQQQQVPFETLCGTGGTAGGSLYLGAGGGSSSNSLTQQLAPQQQQQGGSSSSAAAPATATTSCLFSILPGGTRVEGGLGAAEFSHLMNVTAVATAQTQAQQQQQQQQPERRQQSVGVSGQEEAFAVVGRPGGEGGVEGQQGTASSEEDQSIGSNQQGSGTDGDGSGSMKDRSRTNGHGHGEVVKVKREPSTSAGTQQRQQPRQNALGPMHSSGQSTRGGDGSGATTTTTTAGGGTKRPHSPDAAAASTDDENSRLADVVLRPHPKGRRTSHTSRQAASYSGAPSPSPAPASPPHHKHPTPASLPFDAVHLDGSQPVPLGRSSAPLNSSSSSYSHRVRARSSSAQSQSHAHPVHQREGTPIAGAHRLARSQQQQQQQEQTVQLMGLHQGPNTSAGAGWVGDSSRSSSDHCHATSFHNSQGNSGLGAAAAHYPAPPGRVESRSRGEHNSRSVPQTDFEWMIREFEQIDDDSGPCCGYNWMSTGPTGGAEQQQQQQQQQQQEQVALRQQQQLLILQQRGQHLRQGSLSPFLRSSTPPYASSMGSGHTPGGGGQELLQQNSAGMKHVPGSACVDSFRAAYSVKLEEVGQGTQVLGGPAADLVSQHWQQQQQQQQQQHLGAVMAAAAAAGASGGDSGEGDVGSNSTDDSDPAPGVHKECRARGLPGHADARPGQPPTGPTPASFDGPVRAPTPLPFDMAPTPDLPRSISPSPSNAALDSLPLPLEPLLPFGPRSSPPDSATLMPLDTPSPPVVSNDSALGAVGNGGGGGGSMGVAGGGSGNGGESEAGNGPQALACALSLPEGCPAATCTQSSGSMADIDALLN